MVQEKFVDWVISMRSQKTYKLLAAALCAALCCVATMAIHIPLGVGFANLGDCMVILSGALLGWYGVAAAAVGSAIADLLLGFGVYAPATFIIKGLMALIIWRFAKTRLSRILSVVGVEVLMVAGYFAYECCILSPAAALVAVLGNAIQGAVCGLLAAILLPLASKIAKHPPF